jgi:hypothetical protein
MKTKKAAKYIIKHPVLFTEGEQSYARMILRQKKIKKLLKKTKNESSETNLSNT